MEVRAERLGSAMVINLDGRLTVESDACRLPDLARGITRFDTSSFVMDLANLRQLDSYGVGQLAALHKELQASGVPLVLINVEWHQKRLLQVSGLLGVLRVFDGWHEALCAYAAGAGEGPLFGSRAAPCGAPWRSPDRDPARA